MAGKLHLDKDGIVRDADGNEKIRFAATEPDRREAAREFSQFDDATFLSSIRDKRFTDEPVPPEFTEEEKQLLMDTFRRVDAVIARLLAIIAAAEGQRERVGKLEAELATYKRLYELRGKALQMPCPECGHVPVVIKPMEG